MGDARDIGAQMLFTFSADDILCSEETGEPGEVSEALSPKDGAGELKTVVPSKIYIRGLESLHTDDLEAYLRMHCGAAYRIEWIDDTSANLVFGSDPTAREAIESLSSVAITNAKAIAVGELLPAKPFSGRPDISLHVRFALQSDKKRAGSAIRSRYYLLHPEHDPGEKRRGRRDNRHYRDRGGDRRRDDAKRDGSGIYGTPTYEASMYDDVPQSTERRRYSDLEHRSETYVRHNHGKELFRGRPALRDRSASPRRLDDGQEHEGILMTSRSNRLRARSITRRLSTINRAKELFPRRSSDRSGQLSRLENCIGTASLREEDMPNIVTCPDTPPAGVFSIRGLASQRLDRQSDFVIKGQAKSAKELFPDKLGSKNVGKELPEVGRQDPGKRPRTCFRKRGEDIL
ncbi:hypothetical protein CDD83_5989 [Cordyceps sp. RAO-2017]|nr:hypothetical protein CDD83_5989 [Cordyceps sp. RAO-2017]